MTLRTTTVKGKVYYKEFISIIILLLIVNFAAIFSEDIIFIRWSRILSSSTFFIYLTFRHYLYRFTAFFIGIALLVITDVFYVFIEYESALLLYLGFSALTFLIFVIKTQRFIIWREISQTNLLVLLLLTFLVASFLYFLRQLVNVEMEQWLLVVYSIYVALGLIYCAIAVISYLQLDRTGNGNYLYISYGFFLSNGFLFVAYYNELLGFYYFSRAFYLISLLSLVQLLLKRLTKKQHISLITDSPE